MRISKDGNSRVIVVMLPEVFPMSSVKEVSCGNVFNTISVPPLLDIL